MKSSYYGLGWNVDYDAANRLILSHSGAFFLGTGTTVKFSPSEQLGIIVLTNALPKKRHALRVTFPSSVSPTGRPWRSAVGPHGETRKVHRLLK